MTAWEDGWTTGFVAAAYLFAGYYDAYAELRDERFARVPSATESHSAPPHRNALAGKPDADEAQPC